jgi:hypothetical protein
MRRAAAREQTQLEKTSSVWKRDSTLPESVIEGVRKSNYTRSVRFKYLKELSRLQFEAGGAKTYDGVNQHQFGRTKVGATFQRQAWRRRWEWCTYCEAYDQA